jgi:hypothetical protein
MALLSGRCQQFLMFGKKAVKKAQTRLNTAEEAIDFDDVVASIYGSSDFAEGVKPFFRCKTLLLYLLKWLGYPPSMEIIPQAGTF